MRVSRGGMTLGGVIRENARSVPTRQALICADRSYTYSELEARSQRLAAALQKVGVSRGDRVAWIAQNCHRWVELLVACARIGAVLGSMSWRQTASELSSMLADWAPRAVFWQQADSVPVTASMRQSAGDARWVCIDSGGEDGYEALLAKGSSLRDESDDPESPVLAMFVADASGRSSASLLTHSNLLVPALVMAQVQRVDERTVNLASAPLFHIASLFTLVPTIQMCGVNVMVRRADAALICEAIHQHRCTHGFVFGPTAEAISDLNADGMYDLKSFRSGLPNPRWRALVAPDDSPWGMRSGGYGQTETGMIVLSALCEGGSSTSGRTAPYAEIRVVDSADRDVALGEIGQIIVRGASVHAGYWNRPLLNAERFRNGWWHTGDLGRRESAGLLSFVGPMGRIIKSGAENIFGAEVERCIASHPAVLEAAVIGLPDTVWVQIVCAIVVVRPDHDVNVEELLEYCRRHLASYKKPRSIVIQRDPLRRAGGIVDYATLDAQYGGGNYPGEGTRST